MKKSLILLLVVFTTIFYSVLSAQAQENYQLSTHILDINQGKPASDVSIILFKMNEQTQEFEQIASGKTDNNGRLSNFLSSTSNNEGIYKLKFETLPYFNNQEIKSIYPFIEVLFQIQGDGHYHIPITVSANGYSTYRGS